MEYFDVILPKSMNKLNNLQDNIKIEVTKLTYDLNLIGFRQVKCLDISEKTMPKVVSDFENHTYDIELPFTIYPMLDKEENKHTVRHELCHIHDYNAIYDYQKRKNQNRSQSLALSIWAEFYANYLSADLQTDKVLCEFIEREKKFRECLENTTAKDPFLTGIDILKHIGYNYGDLLAREDLNRKHRPLLAECGYRNTIEEELYILLQIYPLFDDDTLTKLDDIAKEFLLKKTIR